MIASIRIASLALLIAAFLATGTASPAMAQEAPIGNISVDGVVHEVYEDDDFAVVFNGVVRKKSRLVEVRGDFDVTGSLDLSSHRHITVFDFSGARLYAYMDGGAVIDMTRTTGATVRGLYLSAPDPTQMPRVGLLQSRDLERSRASGKNRFYDINIGGHFAVAPMYNIGSEASEFFGVRLTQQNPLGVAGLYLTRRNDHQIASEFGYTPGNTLTANGQFFQGLQIWCYEKGNQAPGIVIAGFSNVSLVNTYIRSVDAPYIHLDASLRTSTGLYAPGLVAHGNPQYGILIDGDFSHVVGMIDISARLLPAEIPIYIGAVDVVHARLTHSNPASIVVDPAARLKGVEVQERETGWFSLDQEPSKDSGDDLAQAPLPARGPGVEQALVLPALMLHNRRRSRA